MSRVLAIANQKGGVGKTTTAINLGASLAAAEQRVLVIDLDPQGNASRGLGIGGPEAGSSLYGVLLDCEPLGSAIVRGVHLPQLDVVPTTIDLVGAEVEMVALPRREFQLRRALDGVRSMYDFVLLDCPPAIGLLTLNALVAADGVILPVQTEFYALEGLSRFVETIRVVRDHLNPQLELDGVLLTLFDGRLRLAREVAEEVERHFGDQVFRTRIPRTVGLGEAPGFGEPILTYDIASVGAGAYIALAGEILRARGPRTRPWTPPPQQIAS